jgi:hypothetical protein
MKKRVNSKLFYINNRPLTFKLPNNSQKSFFKEKILEGGGVVIESEDADIIIFNKNDVSNAQNVYKEDIVIDSYFYNQLQELDKYKVRKFIKNQQPQQVIKINGPMKMRKKRIEYTREDDKILASYVKDCLYPQGKNIYLELEEKYPHHSWQSWKERYKKVVGPAMRTGNWSITYFSDKHPNITENNNRSVKNDNNIYNNDNNDEINNNNNNNNHIITNKAIKPLKFVQRNNHQNSSSSSKQKNENNNNELYNKKMIPELQEEEDIELLNKKHIWTIKVI